MKFLKNAVLFLLIFLLVLPAPVAAQEVVTPTLYCLGNCPGDPTATPPTTSVTPTESITPSTSPSPTTETTPTEPTPTVNPCETESSVQHYKHKKHKKHKKKGFLGIFFEFILKIFQLIFQLFGGQQPQPQPLPEPTIEPTLDASPSATVEPTVDPCATPTVPAEPTVWPTSLPSGAVISPTISSNLSCLSPVWSSSDPNGMQQLNGFFLHNNMWNASAYPDTKQTIYACSASNWYVTSTATDNGDGAVKTYPNVHKDYNAFPLSSLTTITSSYSHVAPATGNWNVAYDIWINGIGNGNGSTELMIWTEAKGKQASAVKTYPKQGTVTLSGTTYNIYKNNTYIVYEMSPYKNSGSVNLKEIFDDVISRGFIPANSTLHQVDYGVEVVSTDGAPATFKFTNFTINSNE